MYINSKKLFDGCSGRTVWRQEPFVNWKNGERISQCPEFWRPSLDKARNFNGAPKFRRAIIGVPIILGKWLINCDYSG